MSTFTLPLPGISVNGLSPSTDSYIKSTDANPPSDRIVGLQNFLLGSDWSSLSSLSPSTAPVHAVVEQAAPWPLCVANLPLLPSSEETVKPTTQNDTVASAITTAVNVVAPIAVPEAIESSSDSTSPTIMPAATTAVEAAVSTLPYPSCLTPPHRHSFDNCYSDSEGSPDSERDFLTSPSMFDDTDFSFDADMLANAYPLFTKQSYEDPVDLKVKVEDPVGTFASNLENVKLEADEHDSQPTETDVDASQSTVMPSQSQVKVEEEIHDLSSTLDDVFKTEADDIKVEPKFEPKYEHEHEHDYNMWSQEELKPYYDDEDTKALVLSTLANAFGHDFAQPVKEVFSQDKEQTASQIGPVRSSRGGNRERRASPGKRNATSASASPAPTIDPVTKAKRWQCTECGKWFDRAYNLQTHRYTHEDPETRARPFLCPDHECPKQFARKHDMQRHFENVHRGESRRVKGGSVKRSRAIDLG